MKISKIIAIASAAVLMVACGTPAAEGSKEVKALLPNKAQVDSASYLIGVNFGSWIKGNNFGEINYDQMIKGIKDWMKAEGTPQDSTFFEQFKIDPNKMNEVLDGYIQKRRAYTLHRRPQHREGCEVHRELPEGRRRPGDRERPCLPDHRGR